MIYICWLLKLLKTGKEPKKKNNNNSKKKKNPKKHNEDIKKNKKKILMFLFTILALWHLYTVLNFQKKAKEDSVTLPTQKKRKENETGQLIRYLLLVPTI